MNDPSPRLLNYFAFKIPELAEASEPQFGLQDVTWLSLGDGPEKEPDPRKPLTYPLCRVVVENSAQQGNSRWWDVDLLAIFDNEVAQTVEDPDAGRVPKSPYDAAKTRQQNLWLGFSLLRELGKWYASETGKDDLIAKQGVYLNGFGHGINRPAQSSASDLTLFTQEVRWSATACI